METLKNVVKWLAGFFEDQEAGAKINKTVQSMKRATVIIGAIGGYHLLNYELKAHGISDNWVRAFQVWSVACGGVYVFGLVAQAFKKGDKDATPPAE